jgi:hypothetical protein
MTTATFNIGKKLTIVTGNIVYVTKLSEITNELKKFNSINIKGLTSESKFKKYINSIKESGYKVIYEDYIRLNSICDGSADFSITFSK